MLPSTKIYITWYQINRLKNFKKKKTANNGSLKINFDSREKSNNVTYQWDIFNVLPSGYPLFYFISQLKVLNWNLTSIWGSLRGDYEQLYVLEYDALQSGSYYSLISYWFAIFLTESQWKQTRWLTSFLLEYKLNLKKMLCITFGVTLVGSDVTALA
jgi:hypothetical protein